jgi:hypothetical protein
MQKAHIFQHVSSVHLAVVLGVVLLATGVVAAGPGHASALTLSLSGKLATPSVASGLSVNAAADVLSQKPAVDVQAAISRAVPSTSVPSVGIHILPPNVAAPVGSPISLAGRPAPHASQPAASGAPIATTGTSQPVTPSTAIPSHAASGKATKASSTTSRPKRHNFLGFDVPRSFGFMPSLGGAAAGKGFRVAVAVLAGIAGIFLILATLAVTRLPRAVPEESNS